MARTQRSNGAAPLRLAPEADDGVQSRITELVTPLITERDQLIASRETARARVAMLDHEIVTVERVLKAAGHQAEKPKTAKNRTPKTLSKDVTAVIAVVLKARAPVTGHEVGAKLSISHKSAARRLAIARDMGYLRSAGARANPKGRDSALYAPLPDTAERLAAVAS